MADQRLTWLTRRPTGWSLVVPFVAVVAGALFATSAATAGGSDLRSETADLPGLIRGGTRDNAVRAEQVKSLQDEVARLSEAAAPGNTRLLQLTRQASALSPTTGTGAVAGPALAVTLDDSDLRGDQIPEGMTADDVVVHQQDVQGVVNALWAGGAEAMMVMDQRIVSTSAVRCVGNTLILQGRVYSPPYTITAIGDRDRMRSALDRDRSVQVYRQYVDAVGLGYEVADEGEVTFPAYAGSVSLRHATVER